jgi:hypothetical protein
VRTNKKRDTCSSLAEEPLEWNIEMAKTKLLKALIFADPTPVKLERLLRIMADVETVTDRGNAMIVLGRSFHFYFIEKGIPNGSAVSDLIAAQNEGERPLIYLIADDNTVTEDDLAKYNAVDSIPSAPSRADFARIGILIPNRLKRASSSTEEPRELNGEVIQFPMQVGEDAYEEEQGSLMALEEPEEAAEDEPFEELEPEQELIPEDLDEEEAEEQSSELIPPAPRRAAVAFFEKVRSRFSRDAERTVAVEYEPSASSAGARWKTPAIAGIIVALIIGIGVFAEVANRPASSSKKNSSKTTTTRTPESTPETTLPSADTSTPATTEPTVTANDNETPRESTPATSPEPSPEPVPTPAPAPEPVNNKPSVSISGPGQLMRGQSATYTASASDPDGDSVSLNWTSRAFCSDVPGTYSLSVTATDSRGASSSYSISISVI